MNTLKKETPLEQSINKYMKIKYDDHIINKAAKLALFICKEFEKQFSDINFEFRYRIKSDSSLKKKLLKLEAERLEDLFFIDKLPDTQMDYLKNIIIKKYMLFKQMDKESAKKEFDKLILRKNINRIEEKQLSMSYIEEKGRNPEKPEEYLKLFDIIGMKLIINNVPKNYKTSLNPIDKLIEKRDSLNYTTQEYKKLDEEIRTRIILEFMDNNILTNENLNNMGLYSLKNRRKNVVKTNGYKAAHSTLVEINNEDFTYEFQGRTKYVEKITQEGVADHSKRFGKNRNLPKTTYNNHQIENLRKSIPEYYIYRQETKDLYKCNFIENTYYYYLKDYWKDSRLLEKLWNVDVAIIKK